MVNINVIEEAKLAIGAHSLIAPLIISGQSILSAGGQGAEGNHYGEISKIKQLPKNTSKEWSKKVPLYWSGKTIYAESVLKALKK